MADNARIEELRRRVQKDPASIAFAQLAEEYRRAGRYEEAIETCEAGLGRHPGYLSAHVTLGRSLIEVGQLDRALDELSGVLQAAPENLAALRGLAEIHHRQGTLGKALDYYRAALDLARHDPDLEQVVAEISRELEPRRPPPAVVDGLTFEQVRDELFSPSAVEAIVPAAQGQVANRPTPIADAPLVPAAPVEVSGAIAQADAVVEPLEVSDDDGDRPAEEPVETVAEAVPAAGVGAPSRPLDPATARVQIAELERWLEALGPEPPAGDGEGRTRPS